MEIERKFTIKELPADLESYPFHHIEQAYLNETPVIRVRKEDDDFYLTYKGSGMMSREEYNLPLNKNAYDHLLPKADGNVISKKRYRCPIRLSKRAISFLHRLRIIRLPLSWTFLIRLSHHSPWQKWNLAAGKPQKPSFLRTGLMKM